jgi:hypothetical protein
MGRGPSWWLAQVTRPDPDFRLFGKRRSPGLRGIPGPSRFTGSIFRFGLRATPPAFKTTHYTRWCECRTGEGRHLFSDGAEDQRFVRLLIPGRNASVPDDQNAHISYLIASGLKSSGVASAALRLRRLPLRGSHSSILRTLGSENAVGRGSSPRQHRAGALDSGPTIGVFLDRCSYPEISGAFRSS